MPSLLTTREAAAKLQATPRAFLAWARAHAVPFVQVRSRVVRWDAADLDAAIEAAKVCAGARTGSRVTALRPRRSRLSASDRIARSAARVMQQG